MGRKIFVSYKYWDSDVAFLPEISDGTQKVRDYVTWIEKRMGKSDNIYKGESDNEDLSDKSEDYIWRKLKDKIADSTLTIVLISPNMKEPYKHEKSQWIPWEISYSLSEYVRNDRTSRSNALLAVILPNRNFKYDYYDEEKLFRILSQNIKNGYVNVIKWDKFINDIDKEINTAYILKEIYRDKVIKKVTGI